MNFNQQKLAINPRHIIDIQAFIQPEDAMDNPKQPLLQIRTTEWWLYYIPFDTIDEAIDALDSYWERIQMLFTNKFFY